MDGKKIGYVFYYLSLLADFFGGDASYVTFFYALLSCVLIFYTILSLVLVLSYP